MSIWKDEWEDYENEKEIFEAWLDSLEGEGTDEEKYNREMEKQHAEEKQNGKYQDHEYERWLDDNIDDIYENEIMNQAEYPEWMVKGKDYIMTVSNN
jgi:hypothetical protein